MGKNIRYLVGISIVLVAAVLIFIFLVPKYPQPGYAVGTYDEAKSALPHNPEIIVPYLDGLPIEDGTFMILLKSRFWYDKSKWRA